MWFAYIFKLLMDSVKMSDHDIYSVEMIYSVDTVKRKHVRDAPVFWKRELDQWYDYQKEYWADVTREYKSGELRDITEHRPKNLTDIFFRIKYNYRESTYKYVSTELPDIWPIRTKLFVFNMPIKEAVLIDNDGGLLNVTRKIKKCAGPKHDFHGESVRVKDIFTLDISEYSTLRVTNLANQTRVFDVHTDTLTHPLFL